jgi:magnesium transporter
MARFGQRRRKRRRLYRIQRRTRPGAAPGTVAVDPHAHATAVDLFGYGPDGYVEEKNVTPERVVECLAAWPITWVNVEGLADAGILRRLADIFRLHPLVREDVVNVHQRPKVEQYDGQLFIVTRMMSLSTEGEEIESEQLSIVFGERFVVTFQDRPGDVLDPVRERIRAGAAIRRSGADYLAYALVDAVVDHYFPLLERYGERLEALEEETIASPDGVTLAKIHQAKRDLLLLRRSAWPQRDALAELSRDSLPLVSASTRVYLRDCYDHSVQVIDLLESFREMASALLEIHVSMLSNRLNEVMKVLTIFSTIFIPLTFVTSLYGMNFDPNASPWNMPELRWAYGYPFVLAVMLAVAVVTFGYIYRKGWVGKTAHVRRDVDRSRDVE